MHLRLVFIFIVLSISFVSYKCGGTTTTSSTNTSDSSHTTTTESSSSDSHGTSSHVTNTEPIVPNQHDGGFPNNTEFPSNFTCTTVKNPQNDTECTSLSQNDKGYTCCFVKTMIMAKSINNSCIPLNYSNLPAIQFLIKNMTLETESLYTCQSMIDRFTFDILILIILTILLN